MYPQTIQRNWRNNLCTWGASLKTNIECMWPLTPHRVRGHTSIILQWILQHGLRKPLSINIGRPCIYRCKSRLNHAKPKSDVNDMQRLRPPLCDDLMWDTSPHFKLFLGTNGCQVLQAKGENDHSDHFQRKVERSASVIVWGRINAYGIMGNPHVCEGTTHSERHIQV